MFRTDFEKHSLDYRRKLKPDSSARPYCAEWSAHAEWSGHLKSYLNGMGFLFWTVLTKFDTNSYLGPILKGTMANNHDNPNPDVSA